MSFITKHKAILTRALKTYYITMWEFSNNPGSYCSACLYVSLPSKAECADCISGGESADNCIMHAHDMCYSCFYGETSEEYIIYEILHKIYSYASPVTDITKISEVLEILDVIDKQAMIDKLFVENMNDVEKAVALINIGANVDMDFFKIDDAYTILSWALAHKFHEIMEVIAKNTNGAAFAAVNSNGFTAFGEQVNMYMRGNTTLDDNTLFNNIMLLKDIGYPLQNESLNNHKISELNYQSDQLLRQKINTLLDMGVTYDLDACAHKNKKLKHSNLGIYLLYRNAQRLALSSVKAIRAGKEGASTSTGSNTNTGNYSRYPSKE